MYKHYESMCGHFKELRNKDNFIFHTVPVVSVFDFLPIEHILSNLK